MYIYTYMCMYACRVVAQFRIGIFDRGEGGKDVKEIENHSSFIVFFLFLFPSFLAKFLGR